VKKKLNQKIVYPQLGAKLKKKSRLESGVKDKTTWTYEHIARMGGAAGEAYTNTLAASGMPPASVLAREAIQNSVDAGRSREEKVSVDFVTKVVSGEAKTEFVRAAGLKSLASRASDLGFKEPNCIKELSKASAPLHLLFINDYNTTGLAGDPSSPIPSSTGFYCRLAMVGK
jgi:hypothetical protein